MLNCFVEFVFIIINLDYRWFLFYISLKILFCILVYIWDCGKFLIFMKFWCEVSDVYLVDIK